MPDTCLKVRLDYAVDDRRANRVKLRAAGFPLEKLFAADQEDKAREYAMAIEADLGVKMAVVECALLF